MKLKKDSCIKEEKKIPKCHRLRTGCRNGNMLLLLLLLLFSNVRQAIWRERVDMHTKLYGPLPEQTVHLEGESRHAHNAIRARS